MPEAVSVRPDDATLADAAGSWRGAYVHIPFCARVCPYCDFAVVANRDDAQQRYVDAVVSEIRSQEPWGPLDAVHVGGGTPTRLPVSRLAAVVTALADHHGLAVDAEVALEANPEDWSATVAAGLVRAGFTRVSLGAQSFDPVVLGALGRRHTPRHIDEAVGVAREAGFRSVSLDLMFGTPEETAASWSATLGRALGLEPDHVSTYALTVERGTPLGRSVAAGAPAPDPDRQAAAYEEAVGTLSSAGLIRYEVSNFARPGHHSRYNLLTWSQGEYQAAGLGAHGHVAGRRWRNVRRLDDYVALVAQGRAPRASEEVVTGWEAERERVFLGIRRVAGVAAGRLGHALLAGSWGTRLADAEIVALRRGRLVVPRPLWTDEVARAVLAVESPDC